MSQTIKTAVVQMKVELAPTDKRLDQAGQLIASAARSGAQVVVLPELFNTGYAFSDSNYRLAEKMDGATVDWMKNMAAHHNVYLAGSMLLLDYTEIYNALLLVAPDGQIWRYDKNYPWGWERAYCRSSNRVMIAHTGIGDIGMMICWDAAHPELWSRYAGNVDLMIISSCPPDIPRATYYASEGYPFNLQSANPIWNLLGNDVVNLFDRMINQQAAWLQVPVLHASCSGRLITHIPNGRGFLLSLLLLSPWLVRYFPQADQMLMSTDMVGLSKIVDRDGLTLARLQNKDGEDFILSEIELEDKKSKPKRKQPNSTISWLTYFASDVVLYALSAPIYRQRMRRALGKEMARVDASTYRWMLGAGFSAFLGLLLGFILGVSNAKRKKKKNV